MSSNGLILVNSLFHPIFADPESIKILGYPNAVANPAALDSILAQKILSFVEPDLLTSAQIHCYSIQVRAEGIITAKHSFWEIIGMVLFRKQR